MNGRGIPILRLTRGTIRSFHFTAGRFTGMEGVTSQELEAALKSRLSATHTQVNDISGPSLSLPELSSQVDVVNHMKSSS